MVCLSEQADIPWNVVIQFESVSVLFSGWRKGALRTIDPASRLQHDVYVPTADQLLLLGK